MSKPLQRQISSDSLKQTAKHIFGQKHFGWWTVLYTILFILVSGWLPDGVSDFFSYFFSDKTSWVINYKLIFSITVLSLLGLVLTRLTSTNIDVSSDISECSKILVLFLSSLEHFAINENEKQEISSICKNGSIKNWLIKNNIDNKMLNGTKWEMPIKAIEHHKKCLEYVYLITSFGKAGSAKESEFFSEIVQYLYPDVSAIVLSKQGIDFEDIKIVFNEVENVYCDVTKRGYKEKDVLIDITSGMKTNSIAASIAALARGRKFQYISYDKVVKSYDIEYLVE